MHWTHQDGRLIYVSDAFLATRNADRLVFNIQGPWPGDATVDAAVRGLNGEIDGVGYLICGNAVFKRPEGERRWERVIGLELIEATYRARPDGSPRDSVVRRLTNGRFHGTRNLSRKGQHVPLVS
jgi:hypothetical protein